MSPCVKFIERFFCERPKRNEESKNKERGILVGLKDTLLTTLRRQFMALRYMNQQLDTPQSLQFSLLNDVSPSPVFPWFVPWFEPLRWYATLDLLTGIKNSKTESITQEGLESRFCLSETECQEL